MKKIISILFAFLLFSYLEADPIKWTSPPVSLSTEFADAWDPQIAMDPYGDVVAVWMEDGEIKSNFKYYYTDWHTTSTLSGTGASSPRVVMDPSGNATAIWIEMGIIKASTKTYYGDWTPAITLSNVGAFNPVLCADAAGNVVAAWVRNSNIETSTKLANSGWQTPDVFFNSVAGNPTIAIGGAVNNSRVFLAWEGRSADGHKVINAATKLVPGGAWSNAATVSEENINGSTPFVAADNNGNGLIIWYGYEVSGINITNVIVKTSSFISQNGKWGAIDSLSEPGCRNPSNLSAKVAFDGSGNAIALWNTSLDGETFNIQSAVKMANQEWSPTTNIINANLYAYSAELSSTVIGNVLSLYMFYNGSSLLIQAIESDMHNDENNFWSVPLTISEGDFNAYPKIAATVWGNTLYTAAIWLNFTGTSNMVAAMTGIKYLLTPPSNLTVEQGINYFGVFTEFYNTISWTPSPDPKVVGYLIYRNGVFLDQVDSSVSSYIDSNRAPNESLEYTIVAIDAQQNRSAPITVSFP